MESLLSNKEIKITTSAVDMNESDFESVFNIISKLRENGFEPIVVVDDGSGKEYRDFLVKGKLKMYTYDGLNN